jgi:hypothetical protein
VKKTASFNLIILLIVFQHSISNKLLAQSSSIHIDQQLNGWFNPSLNIKLHKYIGFYVEGQLRFSQFIKSQQHQIRGTMDMFLTNNITISPIGYVYTWNYQYGKQPLSIPENFHCFFEQINIKHNTGRVFLEQRARLEQRWQENKIEQTDGSYKVENYTYQNRFRYRFMINVPINKKMMSAGTVFLSAWDEVFVSFGKNIHYNLPDQNRIYGGLGYKFNKYGTVQLGYLNQLIIKKEGTLAESNHTLFLGFNYLIDFTKKKKFQ